MRPFLLLACATLCTATAPAAQIGAGLGTYALDYARDDAEPVPTFDGGVLAGGFYSETGLFQVFYGSDAQPSAPGSDASVLGLDLLTTGAIPITTLGDDVEVTLFVPLGLNLGYRYLRAEPVSLGGASADDRQTLHLGLGALRLGGGASAAVPLEGTPLGRRLTGSAALMAGAGALSDFDPLAAGNQIGGAEADGIDVYGLHTTTLSLQGRLDGLAGTALGVTLGYTLRSARASPDELESLGDLVGVVTSGGYDRFERLHLVYVGLVF